MATDVDTVVTSPSANINEFQHSTKKLIDTLRHDNKSLRNELSEKEAQLKECTDELAKIIGGGSDQVSESFLIASLQASRKSILELDSANRELLDALQEAQDEVLRLSSAGISLNEKYNEVCSLNSRLHEQIDKQLASETQSKLMSLQDQADIEAQNEQLRAALDEAEERRVQDLSNLQKATNEIETLEKQLSLQKVKVDTLVYNLEDSKTKASAIAFKQEKQKLQEDNDKLINKFKEKLKLSIQSNKDEKAAKEAAEQKSHDLALKNSTLEKQLNKVSGQLSREKEQVQDYERIKDRMTQLKNEAKSMESDNSDLRANNNTLKGEIDRLKSVCEQQRIDLEGTFAKTRESEEHLKSLQQELESSQTSQNTSLEFLERKEKHCQELENRLDTLTISLDEYKSKNDQLNADNSILTNRIGMLDDQCANLQSHTERCERELRDVSTALESATISLESSRRENVTLSNKVIALQGEQAKIAAQHTNQIELLQAQMIGLVEDRDNCKYDIGHYSKQIDIFNSKTTNLKEELKQTNIYLCNYKTELLNAKSVNGELQSDVDRLLAHNKSLEDDLRLSETKIERVDQKNVEIGHLIEENTKLRQNEEALTRQLNRSCMEVSDLKSEINLLHTAQVNQQDTEKKQNEELRSTTLSVLELTSSLEIAQASLREAKCDLEETVESLKTADAKLKMEEKTNAELVMTTKEDALNIKRLQDDLSNTETELARVKQQLGDIEISSKEERSTYEALIRENNSTIVTLKRDIDEYSQKVSSLEHKRKEDALRSKTLQDNFNNLTLAVDKFPPHICNCDAQSRYEASLDKNRELQSQIDHLVEELNKSRLSNIGLEMKREHLEEEIDDLRHAKDENDRSMDEQDEVIDGLTKEIEELKRQLQLNGKRLKDPTPEMDTLQNAYDELLKRNDLLEKRHSDLEEKYRDTSSAKTILEHKRSELTEKLEARDLEVQKMEGKLKSSMEYDHSIQEELKAAKHELLLANEEINIMSHKLDESNKLTSNQAEQIERLQNGSRVLEESVESIQAVCTNREDEYKSKINDLKELLSGKCYCQAYEEIAFSLLNEELVKYRCMVEALQSEVSFAGECNTRLNEEMRELNEKYEKSNAAVNDFKDRIQELEPQLEQAVASNAELLEQNNYLSLSESKARKEKDFIEAELSNLKHKLLSTEEDVNALTQQLSENSIQLSTAAATIDELQNTKQSLRSKVQDTEVMVSELEAELSKLRNEKNDSLTENIRLVAEVRSLEESLSSTTTELTLLTEKSTSQLSELKAQQDELVKMKERCSAETAEYASKMEEIQEARVQLYNEVSTLKIELQVTKSDLEAQITSSAETERNINKYKEAMEKKESEITEAKADLRRLRVSYEENISTMEEQSYVIDELSKERDMLNEKTKELYKENEALNKSISDANIQKINDTLALENVRRDIEGERYQRMEEEGRVNTLLDEITQLDLHNRSLQGELEAQKMTSQQLLEEVSKLNSVIEELNGQISKSSKALLTDESTMTSLKSEIRSLESQLVDVRNNQIPILNQTIANLESEMKSLKATYDQEITVLKHSIEEKETKIVSLNDTKSENEKQITTLRSTNNYLESELKHTRDTLAELEEVEEEESSNLTDLQTQLTNLQNKYDDEKRQSEVIQANLTETGSKLSQVESLNKKLNEATQSLQASLNDTVSKLSESEHTTSVVTKDLSIAKATIDELKNELVTSKNVSQKQIDALAAENENTMKSLDSAESSVTTLTTERQFLSEQLEKLRTELAAKNQEVTQNHQDNKLSSEEVAEARLTMKLMNDEMEKKTCENTELKAELNSKGEDMKRLDNTISYLKGEIQRLQDSLHDLKEVEESLRSDLSARERKYDELLESKKVSDSRAAEKVAQLEKEVNTLKARLSVNGESDDISNSGDNVTWHDHEDQEVKAEQKVEEEQQVNQTPVRRDTRTPEQIAARKRMEEMQAKYAAQSAVRKQSIMNLSLANNKLKKNSGSTSNLGDNVTRHDHEDQEVKAEQKVEEEQQVNQTPVRRDTRTPEQIAARKRMEEMQAKYETQSAVRRQTIMDVEAIRNRKERTAPEAEAKKKVAEDVNGDEQRRLKETRERELAAAQREKEAEAAVRESERQRTLQLARENALKALEDEEKPKNKRDSIVEDIFTTELSEQTASMMRAVDDDGDEVDVPHVVLINIKSANDLTSAPSYLYPTPDPYIVVNSIAKPHGAKAKKLTPLFASTQTSICKHTYNPQWHEDISVSILGHGYLTFNVFSASFSGDSFLGQAVVDLMKCPEVYGSTEPMQLKVPILAPNFMVYSVDGKLMNGLVPADGIKGFLNIALRVPPVFGNMCGWFRQIENSVLAFGDIVSEKYWVELSEGALIIRDSPKGGKVIRTISCKLITDVEEIVYDKLEIAIEALKITVLSSTKEEGAPVTVEELIWGWGSDKSKLKAAWRKALVHTHGSGVIIGKNHISVKGVGKLDLRVKHEDHVEAHS